MLIIGHRGAMGSEPENTLRSFKKAIDLAVQGVELDIYLSKDKKLIVIHDNDVNRSTKGKGLINQMTLAEIKKIDAGRGEEIPTLEEVIDLIVKKNILLNIELKGAGTVVPTVKLIEQKRIIDQVVISSFLYNKLRVVKSLNSKIKTGILIRKLPRRLADFLKLAKTYRADGFHIRRNFLKKKYLEAAHQNNLYIWAWTVDSIREMKKFKSWGVDGLITNYPERAIKQFSIYNFQFSSRLPKPIDKGSPKISKSYFK